MAENNQPLETIPTWIPTPDAETYSGEAGPGCPIGCLYCNQVFFNYEETEGGRQFNAVEAGLDVGISVNTFSRVGNRLLAELPADNAVELLIQHPSYTPDQTVLFENYTDPGLSWDKTLHMMQRVQALGHTGALLTITKLPPQRPKYIEQFQELQQTGGHPIVTVSYGGLPKAIEPGSPAAVRLKGMRRLAEAGIPVVHSFRPLIQGYNMEPEQMREILRATLPYSTVVVPGGLTVDTSTLPFFERNGVPLPQLYHEQRTTPAHVFPGGEEKVMADVRQVVRGLEGESAPVYADASCALAMIMTDFYGRPTPDRMARWAGIGSAPNRWDRCAAFCTATQMAVCAETANDDVAHVTGLARTLFTRLGYPDLAVRPDATSEGLLVVEGGGFSRSELYAVATQCGWRINNLPTATQFHERAAAIAYEVFGLDLKTVVTDCALVDDVWNLVVDLQDPVMIRDLQGRLRSELMTKLVVRGADA